jgi:hypothetical protein
MMTLTRTGTEYGTERWEEPDHSAVEYRADDGAVLRFEAFTGATLGLRRKIGAKITAHHGRLEAAEIDSHYFVRINDEAYDVVRESSSARNATHLEQHESMHGGAIHGGQTETVLPERVDALCRAQWRGARYRYVVSAGELDPEAEAHAPSFPEEFPQHWPAPGGVEVRASSLVITALTQGQRRSASFTVRNREGTPQTITVHPPSHYSFEVDSGDRVIPASASVHVPVRYLAQQAAPLEASLVIDTPSGPHEIQLEGRLSRVSFTSA